MDYALAMQYILTQLAAVAALVERAVQLIKPLYQDHEYQSRIDIGLNVGLNVGICYLWNVDMFGLMGLYVGSFLGPILTGVIASLWSKVVHEVLMIIEQFRKGQPKTTTIELTAVADDCEG
jgi:hypothetical protein